MWKGFGVTSEGDFGALDLRGCEALTTLPAEIGKCASLRTLNLEYCKALTTLPAEIGQCASLYMLNLGYCRALTSLPAEIGQCASLYMLNLGYCRALTSLPAEIGQCAALYTLNLGYCKALTTLPAEIGKCVSLHTLNLEWCKSLSELPSEIGQCASLHTLNLERCEALTSLPAEIGQCASLYTLNLEYCEALTSLPAEIGQCASLRTLNLGYCEALTSLPAEIGQCGSLYTLNLGYCRALSALPAEIGQCASLYTLNLEECEALKGLPAEIGECASLHTLNLESCYGLRELPASLRNTPWMQNCERLHSRVEDPFYAALLAAAVKAEPSLADHTDEHGRRAIDHAHSECMRAMRSALLFHGRYDLGASGDALAHVSRTCVVAFARDMADAEKAGDAGEAVALKFMSDRSAFEREVSFRVGIDGKHVLGVLRTHGGGGDDDKDGDDFATEVRELVSKDKRFRPEGHAADADAADAAMGRLPSMAGAHHEYAYCVVMPRADRSLAEAVQHEHFAGEDWAKIRLIAAHLAEALGNMHKVGRRIHGDIKPLNAVRYDGRWRLIDLDCSCDLREPFGAKQPSTGYCPPEMARLVHRAREAGAIPGDDTMAEALAEYVADASYDMWSLGVVFYQLCTGKTLFHCNQHDDVDGREMERLCRWDDEERSYALDARLQKDIGPAAFDLLCKLLDPDPKKRKNNFKGGTGMVGVEVHPFFTHGTDEGAAVLAEVKKLARSVSRRMGGMERKLVEVRDRLDEIRDQLTVQTRMSRELLSKDHELPTYVVLLPRAKRAASGSGSRAHAAAAAMQSLIDRPGDMFNDALVVHFIDPVSMKFASTNNGEGFELTAPKAWVARAAPYLSASLAVVSAAAVAGRLAGFPVPDLAARAKEYLDNAGDALAEYRAESAKDIAKELSLEVDAVAEHLESLATGVADYAKSFADGVAAAPDSEERLKTTREAVKLGATKLRALLDANHKGWTERCGLKKVTSDKDGYTEWVSPEHEELFRRDGIAALAKRTESGDERATRAEAELARIREEGGGSGERGVSGISIGKSSGTAAAGKGGAPASKSSACVVS
jgi:serine/threonine protein kinase